MIDFQRMAASGELPSSEVVCVEYPGFVRDASKALGTLGGIDAIAQAQQRHTFLQLRLRPSDPYSHPLYAERSDVPALLLRVRRPRAGQGAAAEPPPLQAEIVSRVATTFRFRGMADFQYIVQGHAHSLAEEVQRGLDARTQPTSAEALRTEPLDIVPPLFSPTDIPQKAYVQTWVGRKLITPRSNGTDNATAVGKGGVRRPSPPPVKLQRLAFSPTGPVPVRPTAALPEHVSRAHAHLLSQLEQLFAQRPIWTKVAIEGRLGRTRSDALKLLLPSVAYFFTTGPWSRCYVRFGYDPRASPDSRIYQVMDVRVRGPRVRALPPGRDRGPRAGSALAGGVGGAGEHTVPLKRTIAKISAPHRLRQCGGAAKSQRVHADGSADAGQCAAAAPTGAGDALSGDGAGADGGGGLSGQQMLNQRQLWCAHARARGAYACARARAPRRAAPRGTQRAPATTRAPAPLRRSIQLCDIRDTKLHATIHDPPSGVPVCDPKSGWYPELAFDLLRRQMKTGLMPAAAATANAAAAARVAGGPGAPRGGRGRGRGASAPRSGGGATAAAAGASADPMAAFPALSAPFALPVPDDSGPPVGSLGPVIDAQLAPLTLAAPAPGNAPRAGGALGPRGGGGGPSAHGSRRAPVPPVRPSRQGLLGAPRARAGLMAQLTLRGPTAGGGAAPSATDDADEAEPEAAKEAEADEAEDDEGDEGGGEEMGGEDEEDEGEDDDDDEGGDLAPAREGGHGAEEDDDGEDEESSGADADDGRAVPAPPPQQTEQMAAMLALLHQRQESGGELFTDAVNFGDDEDDDDEFDDDVF